MTSRALQPYSPQQFSAGKIARLTLCVHNPPVICNLALIPQPPPPGVSIRIRSPLINRTLNLPGNRSMNRRFESQ